ncbi:hypothetical protein AAFP35_00710 [Gordonia sp. CPCC 206044]|uniref:hypothetical protein n=1 Tax=Gordonia sp. CPCC 206044 TaxID=3140793 RepID=UPI003AF3552E
MTAMTQNAAVRIAAFVVALAVAFGLAFGIGRVVDPWGDDAPAPQPGTHQHSE